MLQSTLANINRGKRQSPFEPKQFLPRWGRAPKQSGPMDPEDMLRAVKRANKSLGGREVDAGGDTS